MKSHSKDRTMIIIGLIVSLVLTIALIDFARAADTYARQTSVKDTPVSLASVERPAIWSGVWFAALAGYDMANTDLSLSIFGDNGETSFNERVAGVDGFGGEGFAPTVQLGGDVQIGRLVVGGFAEYAFGGVESSAFIGNARLNVEQKDSYSAFASLGVPSGNTLFYVAAGYTWSEAEATLRSGEDRIRRTFDLEGPAAELGIRHRFAPGIQGKLSARYTWFDEVEYARLGDDSFGAALDGETGVWGVKAGVLISSETLFGGGLGIFSGN